ncbi:hypothetical protein [Streptomyces cinereoruber]|uniref:hypothetical protein n=1 Tax=Streptomyces cinereoruber TaxID=67260 RepID=UPI003634940C
MPRYYASPDGGLAQVGDGPLAASNVPEGWEEITGPEYRAREDAARQATAEAAAEFIAADGDVPSDPDAGIPVDDLLPEPTETS